jgi:hypothetical protein
VAGVHGERGDIGDVHAGDAGHGGGDGRANPVLGQWGGQDRALAVPNTGVWGQYQILQKTGVELVAGVQTVRVAMVSAGTSGYVGNFDWFRLTSAAPPPPPARWRIRRGAVGGAGDGGAGELRHRRGGGGIQRHDGGERRREVPDGDGVDITAAAGTGNGHIVGWVKAGEWLEYTVNVATSGTYTLETRVTAVGTGGQIRILVDGEDKTGVLAVPNTGVWGQYQILAEDGRGAGGGRADGADRDGVGGNERLRGELRLVPRDVGGGSFAQVCGEVEPIGAGACRAAHA